jgi:hypothetical protein
VITRANQALTNVRLLVLYSCGHRAVYASSGDMDADKWLLEGSQMRPCPACIKQECADDLERRIREYVSGNDGGDQ